MVVAPSIALEVHGAYVSTLLYATRPVKAERELMEHMASTGKQRRRGIRSHLPYIFAGPLSLFLSLHVIRD